MSDKEKPALDTVAYWNKRYNTVDLTKSGHIDLPAEYNAWLYRRKQDHVAKALATTGHGLRGNKLLEVAAGSGAWMDFWREQEVGEYLGIDLSERAIDNLKQRFPQHRFLQRDLNDPRLSDATGTEYDGVTAIDVLYHVLDDERFAAVLSDLASVLKPGGVLVIHEQFLHGEAVYLGGYIKWRTIDAYGQALDKAGFDILYRRPTFFFMIQNADFHGAGGKLLDFIWRNVSYPIISRLPRLSGAVGCAVDKAICAMLNEGPSMEVMICRKRS